MWRKQHHISTLPLPPPPCTLSEDTHVYSENGWIPLIPCLYVHGAMAFLPFHHSKDKYSECWEHENVRTNAGQTLAHWLRTWWVWLKVNWHMSGVDIIAVEKYRTYRFVLLDALLKASASTLNAWGSAKSPLMLHDKNPLKNSQGWQKNLCPANYCKLVIRNPANKSPL